MMQSAPGMPDNYTVFYVGVDDVQASLDKAESLGATNLLAPMPIPGVGTIGMFADADGNAIGMFKGE